MKHNKKEELLLLFSAIVFSLLIGIMGGVGVVLLLLYKYQF